MQCNYNSFIQIINFHGLFRNALKCQKTGACRILVPLRYNRFNSLKQWICVNFVMHTQTGSSIGNRFGACDTFTAILGPRPRYPLAWIRPITSVVLLLHDLTELRDRRRYMLEVRMLLWRFVAGFCRKMVRHMRGRFCRKFSPSMV